LNRLNDRHYGKELHQQDVQMQEIMITYLTVRCEVAEPEATQLLISTKFFKINSRKWKKMVLVALMVL